MIERNLDNATDTQIKADQIFGKVENWGFSGGTPSPFAALDEYGTFLDLQLNRSRQEEPPLLD